MDFFDMPGALFTNAPVGAPTLADTSAWLAEKPSLKEAPIVFGQSLFPVSLFTTSMDYWLQKPPVSEAHVAEDNLQQKLASLAVRCDSDDDKEVDHSEVVALVRS